MCGRTRTLQQPATRVQPAGFPLADAPEDWSAPDGFVIDHSICFPLHDPALHLNVALAKSLAGASGP